MDNDAIFEANDWETIFKIVDNVVDEIRSQQLVVEGVEGDAVRGGEGDTDKGGKGEMADAVRCGEGNMENEVVENDRISVEIEDDGFSDSIELEDNDVDLENDDAENREEVVRDVDVRDASTDSKSASDQDMARKMTISTPVLQSQEFI
ncbi:hypothetical protein Salat_0172700 [Sesamum alatum]|uniref:Uncharacterized protein n=1 Tax=Sesamum alatum TaxID=300844 RepID=A0AAE1YY13_9LAMI|nr:hypothetical protein Salat_0172700 [Sesamum alatum]